MSEILTTATNGPMKQAPLNPQQEDFPPQGGYPPEHKNPPQQQYPPQSDPPGYSENILTVAAPITTMAVSETEVPPDDYLEFAIFVTMCCCLPLGIVALIKANEAQSRFRRGDHNDAQNLAGSAKKLSTIGFIFGIIMWLTAVIIVIVYVNLIVAAVGKAVDGTGSSDPVDTGDSKFVNTKNSDPMGTEYKWEASYDYSFYYPA